jgi:glutathione S-transferase
MYTLFYTPGACSMVPHIALEECGVAFERRPVDFSKGDQLKPEYLAINPKGRVPALRTDRGVLTEIPAILGFLARSHPEARLAPWEDAYAFADLQAFQMYIATTIHVLFRQISRPESFADGEAAKQALKAKVPEMSNRYFQLIEDRLAAGGPYVHGEAYTSSDIYLFVFGSYLRIGDRGDLSRLPHIQAHRARVRARPAVERTLVAEGLAQSW